MQVMDRLENAREEQRQLTQLRDLLRTSEARIQQVKDDAQQQQLELKQALERAENTKVTNMKVCMTMKGDEMKECFGIKTVYVPGLGPSKCEYSGADTGGGNMDRASRSKIHSNQRTENHAAITARAGGGTPSKASE